MRETLDWDGGFRNQASSGITEKILLDLIGRERDREKVLRASLSSMLNKSAAANAPESKCEALQSDSTVDEALIERRGVFSRIKEIITSSRQNSHYLSMVPSAERAIMLKREKTSVIDSPTFEKSQIAYAQENADDNVRGLQRTLQTLVLRNQLRIPACNFKLSDIRSAITEKPWEMQLLNNLETLEKKEIN